MRALHEAVKAGKTILLEGQLGSLKDPDLGIYPMVTSSSPLAGFGAIGAGGVPPYAIQAARYGCEAQGATGVAFTVLDALGYLDEIPVCVAYELDGKRIDYFPTTTELKRCKPVLEVLPGWKCDIGGIRNYADLPENARRYVEFAEKHIGVPITMVSNGPAREDIIYK